MAYVPDPGIEEAPVDGKLYGRISGIWMEAPRFPYGIYAQYPHWLLDGQTKEAKLKDFSEITWGTPSDGEALVYNSSTQKLEFSPVGGGSGGGGVEEAPNNFFAYVRKGNAWVVGVEGGATTVKAGINSAAAGANGVAIGNKSDASSSASVAIGFNARSRRGDAIAIGHDASCYDYPLGGTGLMAIGASTLANGDGAIALGKGAEMSQRWVSGDYNSGVFRFRHSIRRYKSATSEVAATANRGVPRTGAISLNILRGVEKDRTVYV